MKSWVSTGLILVIGLFYELQAQTNADIWEFNGYIKYLQLNTHINNPSDLFTGQLLHHRINSKYISASRRWVVNASLRNRIFYGEIIKLSPGFDEFINDQSNDFFNLGFTYLERNASLGHSVFDRLNLEYLGDNFEFRMGRQRINWGIHTVWNANDIFNTFSFTDFDYEERPGSDALLARYYYNDNASFEIALKAADKWSEFIAALKWNFQMSSYDVQGIGAFYKNNLMLGLGWAGSIKEFGFKGETSWFYDYSDAQQHAFAISIGVDYSFANGAYQGIGFLYNKLGQNQYNPVLGLTLDVSPKNLYPYKWSIYDQFLYSFHPLWSIGSYVVYSPHKTHGLFLQALLNYNLAAAWDLSFIGQVVFEKEKDIILLHKDFFFD